jgi:CheY-like chemotaxis protein
MPTILYIDDSPAELAAAAAALGEAGHEVITRTGIADIAAPLQRADLVLVDYHMPGMDGGEVVRELRRQSAMLPRTPTFYLYTSDKEVGSDYRELGFDGRVILKGNPEALVKQVTAALRIQSLRELRPG